MDNKIFRLQIDDSKISWPRFISRRQTHEHMHTDTTHVSKFLKDLVVKNIKMLYKDTKIHIYLFVACITYHIFFKMLLLLLLLSLVVGCTYICTTVALSIWWQYFYCCLHLVSISDLTTTSKKKTYSWIACNMLTH